jgi:hypothetical protein
MTVQELATALQDEIAKGNGNAPVLFVEPYDEGVSLAITYIIPSDPYEKTVYLYA